MAGSGASNLDPNLLLYLVIFWPWLACALVKGWCAREMWIAYLLSCLCWCPGSYYAYQVCIKQPRVQRHVSNQQASSSA